MPNNRERGRRGEDTAARFLTERGYEILKRNYRGKDGGEIDIIARKDGCVVFVEVKLRRSLKFGYPREAVGYRKRLKIRKGALEYISEQLIQDTDFRFDVIEILGGNFVTVEHIENAF